MKYNNKVGKKLLEKMMRGTTRDFESKARQFNGKRLTKSQSNELDREYEEAVHKLRELKIKHGKNQEFSFTFGKNQKDKNSKDFKFLTGLNGKTITSKSFNVKTDDFDKLHENELSEKMAFAQLGGLISGSYGKLDSFLNKANKREFLNKYSLNTKNNVDLGNELVALCAVAEQLKIGNHRKAFATASYYGLTEDHFQDLRRYFNVSVNESTISNYGKIEETRAKLEKMGVPEEEINSKLENIIRGREHISEALEVAAGEDVMSDLKNGDVSAVVEELKENGYSPSVIEDITRKENGRMRDIAGSVSRNIGASSRSIGSQEGLRHSPLEAILKSDAARAAFAGKESRIKPRSKHAMNMLKETIEKLNVFKTETKKSMSEEIKETVQEIKQTNPYASGYREAYVEKMADKKVLAEKRHKIEELTQVIESGTIAPEQTKEIRLERDAIRKEAVVQEAESSKASFEIDGKKVGPLAYNESLVQESIARDIIKIVQDMDNLSSELNAKREQGIAISEEEETKLKALGQQLVELEGKFNPDKILDESLKEKILNRNDNKFEAKSDAAQKRIEDEALARKAAKSGDEEVLKKLAESKSEEERNKLKNAFESKMKAISSSMNGLADEKDSEKIKTTIISTINKQFSSYVKFMNGLKHKEGLESVDSALGELSNMKEDIKKDSRISEQDKAEILATIQKYEQLIKEAKAKISAISNESSQKAFNESVLKSLSSKNPQFESTEMKASVMNIIGLVNVAGLSKAESSSIASKMSEAVGSTPIEKVEEMTSNEPTESEDSKQVEKATEEKVVENQAENPKEKESEETKEPELGGDALCDEYENGVPENEVKGQGVKSNALEEGELTEQQMVEMGMARRPDNIPH